MLFAAVRKSVIGQCGQWLGMAFARIVVRDHTDGGTGETRMGMEDERRDPVRAVQHRACTVARRRPVDA